MWKPPRWWMGSNQAAIRNARQASLVLARRRREREEVALFLATSPPRLEQPLDA